jgi:hypothetical protein
LIRQTVISRGRHLPTFLIDGWLTLTGLNDEKGKNDDGPSYHERKIRKADELKGLFSA